MTHALATQREILRSAAGWYALLRSDDVTDEQLRAHAAWLQADPAHRQAWQQVEQLREQLQSVPGDAALSALQIKQRQGHSRRSVLRGFALLATGAAFGTVAWRQAPTDAWMASHRTGTGERRDYTLADGTRLVLNTATSLDVVETPTARLIRLYEGEIHITTGHAASGTSRPLQVHTNHGTVTPLGTVFTVHKHTEATDVTVIEDEVELIPVAGGGVVHRVEAGELARMEPASVTKSHAPVQAGSWTWGLLVAVDWSLGHLVSELGRYRAGVLRCDPAVAGLRVSGTFPLDNTERALQAIANALPVRVDRLTDYWVTIRAAG